MIVHDVEQNSQEWLDLRVIPTASRMHEILTPKTREFSTQSEGYMDDLLVAHFLGVSDDGGSQFMDRGTDLEPAAISYLEFIESVKVERVGFVTLDDGSAGCSPDGLIGDDVGLEIKVKGAKEHMRGLRRGPQQHYCQVQAGLWITGRKRWWLFFYSPGLPPMRRIVERDEEFIGKLAAAVVQFNVRLAEAKATIQAMIEPVETPEPTLDGLRFPGEEYADVI